MAPDIPHLIAAISPDVFCEPKVRKAVREQLSRALASGDRLAYFKAAQIAVPREASALCRQVCLCPQCNNVRDLFRLAYRGAAIPPG